MIALHLAGTLAKFNFPTVLTPELVKAMNHYPNPSVIIHEENIIQELRRKGENQLADALSQGMRKAFTKKRLGPLKRAMLKAKSFHKTINSNV